ncbi:peroxide stress protein YaaA [Haloprofundus sp. MHR1]|uniref:peroxide stress protein YaaA n=1 Tax=Haloprofundus sp. MHR1 TaxID=2572921 RepID=UPI0020C50830|nr:peroxide stress protein YaaA [Haloprofundus sp. MHR1]
MSLLLVQSCSNSKVEAPGRHPALELYSGYFYKIIKKSIREDEWRSDMELRILSAEHGLLQPDDQISYYDRRMDTKRAEELRPKVVAELRRLITDEEYDRIIVNMGREYRAAIEGFDRGLDVTTEFIKGDGIGYKGQVLKRVIRGDDTALKVSA